LNSSKRDDRKSRTPDQETGPNSKKRNFDKRKTRSGKFLLLKIENFICS
jgi:hypothetical protein